MKNNIAQRAAGLFKTDADLEAVYVTADENVFTKKHLAENNAQRCKTKKIKTYKRDDFKAEAQAEANWEAAEAQKQAAAAKDINVKAEAVKPKATKTTTKK